MSHVESISILREMDNIVFWDKDVRISTLEFDNKETAEANLEAIAMFLENSHTTIMAMSPTNEEEL